MSTIAAQTRGRLQFILLATLFFAPMLFATLLYFVFPQWRPAGTVNYGELMIPAKPADPMQLPWVDAEATAPTEALYRGKWTLVVIAGGACDAVCADRLLMTRQVRTALNDKRDRVRRVAVFSTVEAREAYRAELGERLEDLVLVTDAPEHPLASQAFFTAPGLAPDARAIYLIDPLGNWMMRYPGGPERDVEFRGIKKDLSKLLSVSQVG